MPTAAQLEVVIKGDSQHAESALSRVNQQVHESSGFFKTALSNAIGFAGGLTIFSAGAAAVGFLKDEIGGVVQKGIEAQNVMAQTNAVVASTHGVAGMSAEAVGKLAESLSSIVPIDDQTIQSTENLLLTFTSIHKDVFPAATKAALDMSVALKQDAKSSAIQLGKALNDPIKGLTALSRVGVSFTAEQKNLIKSYQQHGEMAKAQGVILKELQTEFGNAGTAAGDTYAGKLAILQNKLDQVKEKIGGALLPVLSKLLDRITPLITAIGGGFADAFDHVSALLTNVTPIIDAIAKTFWAQLQPGIKAVTDAFSGLGGKMGGIDWLSIGRAVGTLASHLGGALSDGLKLVAQAVARIDWNAVRTAIGAVASFITGNLVPAIVALATWVVRNVLPALTSLAGFLIGTVVPAAMALAAWFKDHVLPVLAVLVQVVLQNVLPALEGIVKTVLEKLVPVLQRLWNLISPFLIPAFQLIGWILQNVVGPAIQLVITVVAWLLDKLIDFNVFMLSKLQPGLNLIGDLFKNIIVPQFNATIDVVKQLLGHLGDFLGMLGHIKDAAGGVVQGLGGLGGLGLGGIGGIHLPGFANGTDNAPGGLAVVGEREPEIVMGPRLVNLPRGASVTPLSRQSNGGNGGGGNGRGDIYFNVYPQRATFDGEEATTTLRRYALLSNTGGGY